METFSKGVHRALVPVESQTDGAIAVELVESSPGYRMLTQMDVLSFLRVHGNELKGIMACSVGELEVVNENVFAVTKDTKVIVAIRSMRTYSLAAVPVITAEASEEEQILQDGRGRRVVDTFSATDLRGCSIAQLQSMLNASVWEFKKWVSAICVGTAETLDEPRRKLITCHFDTSLADVIDEAVLTHVHRVWVVDEEGLLRGLVSLTDMLRTIRDKALMAEDELQEVATT